MKLIKKTEIKKTEVTYNLHVKNDHNYIVKGGIIAANCHQLKADSIKGILEKCKNTVYRFGTTGTLDGLKTNLMVIKGLTGNVFETTTTKKLMEQKLLSDLKITCLLLNYNDQEKKLVKTLNYQEELKFLVSHENRNNFIAKLGIHSKNNTLILFQYVDSHGKILYDLAKKHNTTGKQIYFISGESSIEERENVRKIAEEKDNVLIIASIQCFATGINIKRLHNIIFASPSKSRIRVLQSIGRQLRLYNDKIAKLYDIADNLSWKSHKNHTLNHFFERVKIYDSEEFEYKITTINCF